MGLIRGKLISRISEYLNLSVDLSVLRGASTTFIIKVVGAGLGYLMQVLLARWLGASGYGEYTYALAWVSLLAVPAGLGFGTGIIRFIPEYKTKQKGGLLKGAVVRSWQLVILMGLSIAAIGAAIVFGLKSHIRYASLLLLAMGLVPLRALMRLQLGMGRGLEHMSLAYVPEKILRPLLIIGGVGFFVGLGKEINSHVAVWGAIAAFSLACLLQGVAIWQRLPEFAWAERPRYQTKKWLRISLPLLLISGFLLLLNRTDVVMLGILGEASGVGVYNAASRTATLVTFVLMAVNSIAAPKISSLYAEGKREELQELAASVAHYIFWPSVGIAIGIVLLSSYILGLFGSEFVAAQGVLAVLACGQVINAGAGSVGYFMNMTGHQDQSAWVFGTTAVINIVLNGVGIPLLGVKGAAIATAISMAIWNVWLNSLVVRNLGIHASVIGVIRK